MAKKKAFVLVRLEIDVDGTDSDDAVSEAAYVVDELLDAGFFQDAVNEHECEAPPMRVTSAIVSNSGEVAP